MGGAEAHVCGGRGVRGDGRYAPAADDGGAVVLDARRAEQGARMRCSDTCGRQAAERARSRGTHDKEHRVGDAPVGLALVDHDTRVVVADSNRFGASGARSELTVVNAAAALAGRSAVAGPLPAGGFPREMAVEPEGGTLLVGNFQSRQLEAVATSRLP